MLNRKIIRLFIVYTLLAVFVVLATFPFIWMVSTSVKPDQQILVGPIQLMPTEFSLNAYIRILTDSMFLTYFTNSAKVAAVTTFMGMVFAVTASLGFSRLRFWGSKQMMVIILLAQLFPLVLLITPYFTIMRNLGILDSHIALYISYISLILPFSIWMLTNYFRSISVDMEEAAMIDGCTRLQAFTKVTLPLAAPGVVATTINAFILSWNEFLFAQTFLTSPRLRTLPIGLASFIGEHTTQWNLLMAMAVISALPVVVLFIILQKHLIAGLTSGGTKG